MLHTLDNGLRIAARRIAASPVEVCGIAVNVGSRDEMSDNHGLAHFVEHTIFKGTLRRRARHINSRMEAVGGELNAYTSKEETMVYSVFPTGNLLRAMELLSDLVRNATFPDAEVERERQVIADEIDSYLDSPAEAVFDDFEEEAYAGNSAAHNILGSPQSVADLKAADCRRWVEKFYTPKRMLLFYAGPANGERVCRLAERFFDDLDRTESPTQRLYPAISPPFDIVRNVHSHQAHSVVGARIPGLLSDRRITFALLTNILGGPGANSLLNTELREKRALVYTVDATTSLLTDTGLLTVYYGCDPEDTGKCRRYVDSVIRKVADGFINDYRLRAAKRQFIGQMSLSAVNAVEETLARARLTLHNIPLLTRQQMIETVNAISPVDIAQAAASLNSASSLVFTD